MYLKKYPLLVIVSSAALIASGCSSITLIRIKELKQVEYRVDSLKSVLTTAQQEMLREQKSQNELLRLIRADQQVRFDEMGQRISSLEGGLSESKYKLSQIDKKTQEIQEQWEEKSQAESAAKNKKNTEMEKLYQIAYGDFTAGRLDLAINGFADFCKQFPEAPMADDATYWYAECFYAKKEMDKAELGFSDYIRKYREGKKICSALYKLGLVFESKKQLEKRKMVWQKLIATCSTSEEAQAAKSRLGK
jgi:tol-pal system protein YbgF